MPLFYVNPARRAPRGRRRRNGSSSSSALPSWMKTKSTKKPRATGRPPGVPTSTRKNPKKKGRSMPRKRTRRRKNPSAGVTVRGKKVYGAAAKAVARKRAKKAGSHYHSGARSYAAGIAARKKKRTTAKKRTTKRKSTARKSAPRKSTKRSLAAKKAAATRKRKAQARSLAAKKAARTRKRRSSAKRTTTTRRRTVAKKRRSSPKRRRTASKRRRTSPKRRRRTTAKRSYRRIRRRGTNLRRKSRSRRRTGVKTLRRARRTIKYQRAYGSPAARAFMRRYKMRANPVGAVVDTVKRAVPVALSLYGTRFLARKVLPRVPGLSSLGQHAAPAGSLLMLVGGAFITKKVLTKWRQDILLGMGLNFLDVALTTYMPESVKAQIGLSGSDVYDQALGEYVEMGGYAPPLTEPMGEYLEMGEYVEMGAEEELGLEEELGIEAELGAVEYGPASQIGAGIGSNWGPAGRAGSLVRQVPRRAFAAPVPARSFVKRVPEAAERFDAMDRLYTGIFSGGY